MADPKINSSNMKERLKDSSERGIRLQNKLYGEKMGGPSVIKEYEALHEQYSNILKELSGHPSLKLPDVLASGFEVDFTASLRTSTEAEELQHMRGQRLTKISRATVSVLYALDRLITYEDNELEAILQKNESAQRDTAEIVDEVQNGTPLFKAEIQNLRSLKAKLDIIQLCLGPKEETVSGANKSEGRDHGEGEVDGATYDWVECSGKEGWQ